MQDTTKTKVTISGLLSSEVEQLQQLATKSDKPLARYLRGIIRAHLVQQQILKPKGKP